MKAIAKTLIVICFVLTVVSWGMAQTKYRNPLAGSPPIKAWMDHWHTPYIVDSNIRFDGTFIGSGSPYYYGSNPRHRGTDFGVPTGTQVVAGASGTIASVYPPPGTPLCVVGNTTCGGGLGNWVAILHPDGWYSIYAHLSSVSVTQGNPILCGAQIGLSGNTGDSTGSHLHFELRFGLQTTDQSRDPFAGVESQPTEYWNQFILTTDPLNASNHIHYPTTACQ